MRAADWKVIASISIILGIILFIGGIFAYFYAERTWIGWYIYPYRDLTVPLIIAGIVLFVIGLVCNQRAEYEKRLEIESERIRSTMKFCPQCGHSLPKDSKYCPNCGKKLE